MNRAILGVYEPHPTGEGDRIRSRLVAALGDSAQVRHGEHGPLTLAWTGSAERARHASRRLCLVAGHVYNLETIAEEMGVPASMLADPVESAYERWGEGMLDRLRGDFTLLVWNQEAGRGLIAVDQVCGRTLFFHAAGSRLLFASELHHLVRLLPRRPGPDRIGVAHWLSSSRVPPDRTLYEGISRLEAGHYLRIADGRWEKRRYWAPRHRPALRGSRSQLVEELRVAIERAVRRRCANDETTAATLSGGLDSSSIAAVAVKTLEPNRAPVGAYSATFPNHPATDESHWIDVCTGALQLPSTRIVVHGGGVLASSLEFLQAWELPPTATTDFFWLPLLRRAAEDGVSVVLGGDDGDTLFGFSAWLVADLLRHGRLLAAAGMVRSLPSENGGQVGWPSVVRLLADLGLKGNAPHALHRIKRRTKAPEDGAPAWFNVETARSYYETLDPWAWKLNRGPRMWREMADALFTGSHSAGLFDQARRRSEMAGVESRNPFRDLDLMELVLRLPPELAFDPRFSRPLLRASMAGILPDPVRLRPEKHFFDSVVRESLVGDDAPAVRRLLCDPSAEVRAYVRPDSLGELLEGAPPSGHPDSNGWMAQIWRLLTIECWLRFQEHPSFPQEASERLGKASYEFVRLPVGGGGRSPSGRPGDGLV